MRSGDTLGGKYVLETLIGKGGMGVVWAAYDVELQRKVAVKLIIPQNEEALTDELRKRLLREAGACAKLQHPNIIRVFEVGETDEGDAYMVLELLEGQPLGDVLKQKRRLEPKLAAQIAADIASGLSEAHAAHVVHRDLKPANIFLHHEPGMAEDEFVTKVLDFGVCIDRESVDTVKTRAGIAVGSPAYMSPEQVGMRKDIDGRTDIWSLGVMLYEMITGIRVFNGNVTNVMAQIITQPVPAPSSKVQNVPPELDAVVARCTQINKEKRYAEAGELARDLYVIAGARHAVRHPSTSRPSFTKQIGLPGMLERFDAEIHASPAVPKPDGVRAFNPNGATLPLITRDRRAEVEKLPPVIDEVDDLAATMPLHAKMLATLRPKVVEEAANAALGTQLLRKDAPIPSPDPAWKQEIQQALEVHRQSSASLPVFDVEEPKDVVGGTQMLSADELGVRPDVPIRVPIRLDATGTTSMASSMSQEIRLPLRSAPDAAVVTGKRRRQTRTMLFVAAGFLASSVALLVGAVVLSEKAPEKGPELAASVSMPLPPLTSDAVPVVSGQTPVLVLNDGPQVAPSASVVLPATSASAANVAPTVPSATAANTGTPSAPTTTAAATNAGTVPTGAPTGTIAPAGVLKGPKNTKPKVLAPPTEPKCTGFGVFKRCT